MKIAIVLNTSWNIYNFRMNFIRELLAQGHEVHALAPRDNFSDKLVEAGCIYHPIRMDSRGTSPLKDFALLLEFWLTYRKVRPDVVLHYTIKPNIYGSIAASWLGIPAINNVCGLGTVFLKENLVSAVAIFLYRIAFRSPRKVFFQNPDDYHLFVSRRLVSPAVADLLPGSGVDLNRFSPAPFRRGEPFTFLLISRLITDKGVLEFIEAVRALKKDGSNARFQILGPKDPLHQRGIKLPVIDGWVNEGVIEYLGTAEDVRPYIQQADCVVLPSYREGTPRTLLEAAASGKPIVATDVPGCHQVVENHHNGLLCEVKNVADLAAKMRQMMSLSDEELRRFGSNGRKKVEQSYAESLVIDRYLSALGEVA